VCLSGHSPEPSDLVAVINQRSHRSLSSDRSKNHAAMRNTPIRSPAAHMVPDFIGLAIHVISLAPRVRELLPLERSLIRSSCATKRCASRSIVPRLDDGSRTSACWDPCLKRCAANPRAL
jgi:hypothetical protein